MGVDCNYRGNMYKIEEINTLRFVHGDIIYCLDNGQIRGDYRLRPIEMVTEEKPDAIIHTDETNSGHAEGKLQRKRN
jgi:hypothetical protein